jgi:aryl-alcohol dehydrogenase-like predicted oxidoreductase
LGLPRYESLQPNYSLVERAGFEAELEPLCEREGLGVINYFPLAPVFFLANTGRRPTPQTVRARGW